MLPCPPSGGICRESRCWPLLADREHAESSRHYESLGGPIIALEIVWQTADHSEVACVDQLLGLTPRHEVASHSDLQTRTVSHNCPGVVVLSEFKSHSSLASTVVGFTLNDYFAWTKRSVSPQPHDQALQRDPFTGLARSQKFRGVGKDCLIVGGDVDCFGIS